MAAIKTGDLVEVISGRRQNKGGDRGKVGKVLGVYPKLGRVLVEGVNICKRHVKPKNEGEKGGIVAKESPIHISNVLLVDEETGRGARCGFKVVEVKRGKKVKLVRERYSKTSKRTPVKSVKKTQEGKQAPKKDPVKKTSTTGVKKTTGTTATGVSAKTAKSATATGVSAKPTKSASAKNTSDKTAKSAGDTGASAKNTKSTKSEKNTDKKTTKEQKK